MFKEPLINCLKDFDDKEIGSKHKHCYSKHERKGHMASPLRFSILNFRIEVNIFIAGFQIKSSV